MINQEIEEYKKWLVRLSENPLKSKNYLMDADEKGCCLGHYCVVNNIPKILNKVGKIYEFHSKLPSPDGRLPGYNTSGTLPYEHAEKLNIRVDGRFTAEGVKVVHEWLSDKNLLPFDPSVYSLTNVNDQTNIDHKRIGELIAHLAKIEKEEGIECFKPSIP